MGNHYHLVVETPRANVSVGMRQLNGLYASRFNRRHLRVGHLFQARFRSILVESESYLLAVCRYVVLNPVRAGVCPWPSDWHWSSFNATCGNADPGPLALDRLLGAFAHITTTARKRYEDYVLAGLEDALGERVRGERLGDEPFLRDDFGHTDPSAEVPREQWLPLSPPLEELFARERFPIAVAYRRYDYTLRDIGSHLGCHYATVSRALRREEEAGLSRRKT